MDPLSLISVAGGLTVATLSVVLAHLLTRQRDKQQRSEQQADLMLRYRNPLLYAAFDLQSRLFQIAVTVRQTGTGQDRGFIGFLTSDSQRYQSYAMTNTAYRFAEFFCWAEVLRREVQFLDLESEGNTREVMLQLWRIRGEFNAGPPRGERFRILNGEQRAIGELMIVPGGRPDELHCIGYAEFCQRLVDDPRLSRQLQPLLDDIASLATQPEASTKRIVDLQHALIGLVDRLDRDGLRFPSRFRTRAFLPDDGTDDPSQQPTPPAPDPGGSRE